MLIRMRSINLWLLSAKTHKRLIIALALLLPFEYIPSYEVYGLRLRLSFIVGGLLIICAFWLVASKKIQFRLQTAEMFLAGWLAWLSLRSLSADNLKAMLNIILPLVFYVALALSVRLLLKKAYIKQVITALFVGAGLALAFGFYQFIANWLGAPEWATGLRPQYSWQSFGFPRLQSTALEPLYFSAYLLLPFALLASLAIKAKQYRRPIFFALLMAMLLADVLTLSRGGLVALVVQAMIIGMFYINKLKPETLLKITAGFLVVLILCFGLIGLVARQGNDSDVTYGQKGVNTFVSHLKNFSFFATSTNKANDDSVSQRDRARAQARTTLSDHRQVLIFGTGAGQYHQFNQLNYESPDMGEPNNIVLEQLVQFGLVGFGLLLMAGLLTLKNLLKITKSQQTILSALAVGLFAYFVALFLQAQTFTGLALTHLWFAVGLALFLIQYKPVELKKNEKTSQKTKT